MGFIVSALVSGALFSGCADGGSSATRAAGALPAAGPQAVGGAPRGGVRRTLSAPSCSGLGTDAFVGGQDSNVAGAIADGVLAGGGNEVCDGFSSIAGGDGNAISSGANTSGYSFIGAGYENTITGFSFYSFIGAGSGNTLTGEQGAIVSGLSNQNAGTNAMLGAGESNNITSAAEDGVLGGGSTNTLSGTNGVIGGGVNNAVSAQYGVIAGGTNNTVSGEGAYIAAGGYNTASGEGALVDGGFSNTAAGNFATIPGGYENSAAGIYSFAAGVHASAAQNGTFVWSDGSNGDATLASTRAYQFLARAAGGYTLWTNAGATVGATLAPGSGTWASASDRNLKTDVARIDDAAVLDKVAALPIERWSYKSERGVRHVGPMAQDFYAAFGVGEDDKHITSIDEDGVALAAIKALHAENADAHAATKALHAENARLRRDLAAERAHDRRVDAELAHIVAVLGK
jgi:hypothetical protein